MPAKTVRLEEAIGKRLAHDLTEIRPGQFKGPAFSKDHTICHEDLCRLQKMGKNHIAVMEGLADSEIHENEAAAILAGALAGEGVFWENKPKEGKIGLHAALDGLLHIDKATLAAFNMIDEVMCATLHGNTLVKKGELVAATRALPMIMNRTPIDRAAALAAGRGGLVKVKALKKASVGLIITGDEVYHGLIQDRFEPILRSKITALGSQVQEVIFAPDKAELIAEAIRTHLNSGCELLVLTGGMSVDPDDVTRHGIKMAGVDEIHYGSSVLPGAMFLVAYLGGVILLGVPACGLYHRSHRFRPGPAPDSGRAEDNQVRSGPVGPWRIVPRLP